jgi:hypothetical protein
VPLIGVVGILACALLLRFWPSSLTAYLTERYFPPQPRSVQISPDGNLTSLTRPPAFQPGENQARSSYYPFRAVALPGNVGIAREQCLCPSSPPLDTSKRSSTYLYSAQQARFQPAAPEQRGAL